MSQNIKNYSILNLDPHSDIDKEIASICNDLNIYKTHALDKQDALEHLMDEEFDIIVIYTSISQDEVINILQILSQDIENEDTPIVVVSTYEDNETFAIELSEFNVISIITYSNFKAQLSHLLKYLKEHTVNALELKKELIQSEDRSTIDPLTSAYNRYGAEDKFQQLTARFKAYKESFCLIMLDIDHFKKVNDIYGHNIGDQVLVSIADIIKSMIRENDSFVRFGGEEFFVLTSNTNLKIATKIAEKFRITIEQTPHSKENLIKTASFGVVEYAEKEEMESLIKRADLLLYEAKKSGRNMVLAA
ncbi:MAG: diguanylate cyclase [Helicobacteraceae bacterium]|nr:diguanylate cyclase [Helicobacteraceae bacterium]